MFGSGSNKKQAATMDTTTAGNVETLIGKTTSLTGTLSSDGSVRIEGMFEGNIAAKGDVFVGPDSRIKADINGCSVTISGFVAGNVNVSEKLELLSGGTLNGDIKVKKLVIEEGAVFKGVSETRNENTKPELGKAIAPPSTAVSNGKC
jgi:cytoskeletal protein CcmA (bactofilin family)